jgi:hypothetical protein
VAAAFGLIGAAILIALAPIALFIEWCDRMDRKWQDVVGSMVSIATTQLAIVGGIIGTLVEVIENLVNITLAALRGDWAAVWTGMKDTLNSIAGNMISTIGRIAQTVTDLINLIRGIPEGGIGVGNIPAGSLPRSVVPASLMGPSALAVTAGRPAPVFNVTIAHSGLAVDSPRLQREIVDALRRWQKREGPLRGMMDN